MASSSSSHDDRVPVGIPGLDRILKGGLPATRTYLVHGVAGSGKTTLGFQFLMEGARRGEPVMYVTLLQTGEELDSIAHSHGWDLSGIHILELPAEIREAETDAQTVFHPAEVEANDVVDAVLAGIDEHAPQRLVLDSISELAILVDHRCQLRRQILRLKQALSEKRCTALFTAGNVEENIRPLQTLVHGVIALTVSTPQYGAPRRRLEVAKMRGMTYSGGTHDFIIRKGGLDVFPRLQVTQPETPNTWEPLSSGIDELDNLLGGGLEPGTSCLMTGTTGAGKSTLASLYAATAAASNGHAAIFCFDERRETFIHRAGTLNPAFASYVDQGLIELDQINVGELSPGEFASRVVRSVNERKASVVIIDSLTGYFNAIPDEKTLINQLHEILGYLSDRGVLTIMVLATHGMLGQNWGALDTSYIADTVLLARHFEAQGKLRRCVSVVKKRHGNHEKTIRELDIAPDGIRIGEPLHEFAGVLTGVPRFEGAPADLMNIKTSEIP